MPTHRFMPFGRAAVMLGSFVLMLVSPGARADSGQIGRTGLEPIAPEAAGWSSAKLEEARVFADKIGSAAVMVLHDGRVLVSWGQVATKYKVHSIRKPFLGALLGICAARGKIDLDAPLGQLGIDDIPPSLTREEQEFKDPGDATIQLVAMIMNARLAK